LFNINDLALQIRQYDLKKRKTIICNSSEQQPTDDRIESEAVMKDFVEFYISDIKDNQKMNIVAAIGPMRSIFNVSSAFY